MRNANAARRERNIAIAALYAAGKTSKEIGLEFGITQEGVRKILDVLGVERRPKGRKPGWSKRTYNTSEKQAPKPSTKRGDPTLPEQARRMVEAGCSWSEVCAALDISRSTLNWYRRHHWTEPPPEPTRYACPGCGTRAMEPLGHVQCLAKVA
jgi:DNA-binding CsgD family transcriptional regulator